MKRKILPLILIVSLLGTPAPSFAIVSGGGEMARFMLLMMEMFSWMMGGSRNYGNMPYGGYGGYPTGMGSFPGSMNGLNPYSIAGLGALTGTGLPYGNLGLPGAGGLGNLPYGNRNNLYGRQYQPGLYNYYNNPYYGYSANRGYPPLRRPRYAVKKKTEKPAQIVVQPVIIQPPAQNDRPVIVQQPSAHPNQAAGSYPEPFERGASSPIEIPTEYYNQASSAYGAPDGTYQPGRPPSYWPDGAGSGNDQGWIPDPYRPDKHPPQQSLAGEWLGINGEYLVFEGDSFRMVNNDKLTEASYQLSNGIMKAQLRESDKPTYMQYSLQDDYLQFRTEDGQRMMFRRMRN